MSFEQQNELLLLQMDHDKLKQQVDVEKELALENIKHATKQARIALEHEKFTLVREDKLNLRAAQELAGDVLSSGDKSSLPFDLLSF